MSSFPTTESFGFMISLGEARKLQQRLAEGEALSAGEAEARKLLADEHPANGCNLRGLAKDRHPSPIRFHGLHIGGQKAQQMKARELFLDK